MDRDRPVLFSLARLDVSVPETERHKHKISRYKTFINIINHGNSEDLKVLKSMTVKGIISWKFEKPIFAKFTICHHKVTNVKKSGIHK